MHIDQLQLTAMRLVLGSSHRFCETGLAKGNASYVGH
jgi:hypothetical protein